MGAPQYVVVELRVDASNAQQGAQQYSAALDKAQKAADVLTAAANKTQLAITQQGSAAMQASAANDNLARGYRAANDNYQDFGKSLADHAISFVNNVNHLKLMALGAYALSPAFRSFVNTEIPSFLKLIGVNMGLVASAMGAVVSVVAPVLSFFARLALPIGILVAAWQGLNYIITLGSGLLEKYADANRALFAGDVQSNIDKLTKFQKDSISAQQVQYAAELGTRLAEANRTISDFFKVQMDLTDPALKLQAAWVAIVELIAKALSLLPDLPGKITAGVQAIGNSSIWKYLQFGPSPPGAMSAEEATKVLNERYGQPNEDLAAAIAAARNRLAAGLGVANIGKEGAPIGGSFGARFSAAIAALAAPPKAEDTAKQANEFGHLAESIARATAAQEANAQTVGQSVGVQEQLRIQFRLTEAAQQDIAKNGGNIADYYDKIQAAAKRAGDAALALERARVRSDISFGRQTAFLTPQDVQIAQQLKGLYGNDVPAALASSEAAALRLNQTFADIASVTREAFSGMATDIKSAMQNGATFAEAASKATINALNKISDKLIQMAVDQLWSQAFGGGGSRGFNILSLFGIGGGGGFGPGPVDPAFAFHSGGIIGSGGAARYVHPAYYENVPRMHGGGNIDWAAGERLIIGLTGERVLNRAETAAYGRPTTLQQRVIVNNYGADVQTQQHDDGTTELTVRAIARDEFASSRTNAIQKQKFGTSPQLRQRRGV